MSERISGHLVGWKRSEAGDRTMLALQMMESRHVARDGELRVFEIALGDQQLCSLVRDLSRAARKRNLTIWPKKGRNGLMSFLMKPLLVPRSGSPRGTPAPLLLQDFSAESTRSMLPEGPAPQVTTSIESLAAKQVVVA